MIVPECMYDGAESRVNKTVSAPVTPIQVVVDALRKAADKAEEDSHKEFVPFPHRPVAESVARALRDVADEIVGSGLAQ